MTIAAMSIPQSVLDKMKEWGWDFYQYGPEDFAWLKFGPYGPSIAKQGDVVWQHDLSKAFEEAE